MEDGQLNKELVVCFVQLRFLKSTVSSSGPEDCEKRQRFILRLSFSRRTIDGEIRDNSRVSTNTVCCFMTGFWVQGQN